MIKTERLVIRRLCESDLEGFLSYQSHPAVRRYMRGEAMDRDKVQIFLRRQATLSESDRDVYLAWGVALAVDEPIFGDVGMFLPSGPDEVGDLGFQFHPDFHGKGYAREAASALIAHAFTHLNLSRITSSCDAENARSYRLLERLGFRGTDQAAAPGVLSYELTREVWIRD